MKKASVIAIVLGAVLFTPISAFANTLVATSPVSGATLQSAPSAVTIEEVIKSETTSIAIGRSVSITRA